MPVSRRKLLAGFAGAFAGLAGCDPAYARALAAVPAPVPAPVRLWLRREGTKEEVSAIVRTPDGYNANDLLLLSWLLRDVGDASAAVWIDPRLFDLLAAVQGAMSAVHGSAVPLIVTSGYRTPKHNAGLEGAARASLHLAGRAVDLKASGYAPDAVAVAGALCGRGGVGIYPNFCHLDLGEARVWGGKRKSPPGQPAPGTPSPNRKSPHERRSPSMALVGRAAALLWPARKHRDLLPAAHHHGIEPLHLPGAAPVRGVLGLLQSSQDDADAVPEVRLGKVYRGWKMAGVLRPFAPRMGGALRLAVLAGGLALAGAAPAQAQSTGNNCLVRQAADAAVQRQIALIDAAKVNPSAFFNGPNSCIAGDLLKRFDLSNLIPDLSGFLTGAATSLVQSVIDQAKRQVCQILARFIHQGLAGDVF